MGTQNSHRIDAIVLEVGGKRRSGGAAVAGIGIGIAMAVSMYIMVLMVGR
jgi:hypothetical protein